jgi:RNA polymerase sigma-70 factor (ECF subfamily)
MTHSTFVDERTDAALLAAVADGDHDALAELYARHAGWLLARLQRRCPATELVDTALQDTFVSVWRGASAYRPEGGEVGAWLWTIGLRRLVDQLRRRRPATPRAMLPEPTPLPPPSTEVDELLAALPPDLHDVVEAVYLDGLTTHEAGVLLGIPAGTVKSRLSRARSLMARTIEDGGLR